MRSSTRVVGLVVALSALLAVTAALWAPPRFQAVPPRAQAMTIGLEKRAASHAEIAPTSSAQTEWGIG